MSDEDDKEKKRAAETLDPPAVEKTLASQQDVLKGPVGTGTAKLHTRFVDVEPKPLSQVTKQIPKADPLAIMLTEMKRDLSNEMKSGFSGVEVEVSSMKSEVGFLRSDLKNVKTSLRVVEERVRTIEEEKQTERDSQRDLEARIARHSENAKETDERLDRHSERADEVVEQTSAADLEAEAELAKERDARERLEKKADGLALTIEELSSQLKEKDERERAIEKKVDDLALSNKALAESNKELTAKYSEIGEGLAKVVKHGASLLGNPIVRAAVTAIAAAALGILGSHVTNNVLPLPPPAIVAPARP